MPVVKVTSELAPGLPFDRRFKHWAKLIRSEADIALKEKGGYAIAGPFVKWGEACPLADGQFLVLASESGSRVNREYDYALVQCVGQTPMVRPDDAIRADVRGSDLSDEVKAKAENSLLYAYAAFVSLRIKPVAPVEAVKPAGIPMLTAKDVAKMVSDYFNRGGQAVELATELLNDHPTLVQRKMGLVAAMIRQFADQTYGIDLRNQASHEWARKVNAAVGPDHYFPFI